MCPASGTLTLAPARGGAAHALSGTMRSLSHCEMIMSDDVDSAEVEVDAPAHAPATDAELDGAAGVYLGALGSGAMRARLVVDAETASRFDREDEECAALLECCARRAELPALRDADEGEALRAADVFAASDAAAAAAARARWAALGDAEREQLTDLWEAAERGPRPDFFDVFDPAAPPLVVLPGDLRLTVRLEEYTGHCNPGFGTALLLRRTAPAAPPEVAPPTGPPPDYDAYARFRESW